MVRSLLVAVATTQLKSGNWVVNCFNLSGHSDAIRSITLSPDGQILASGSDNTLKSGNWAVVNCFALSLDIRRSYFRCLQSWWTALISGSVDKIKIWNLQWKTAHPIWTFRLGECRYYSPNGRTLASGIGEIIKIWDFKTECCCALSSHSSDITYVLQR